MPGVQKEDGMHMFKQSVWFMDKLLFINDMHGDEKDYVDHEKILTEQFESALEESSCFICCGNLVHGLILYLVLYHTN